jgi:DNA-binding MarR family transcriptional regulator
LSSVTLLKVSERKLLVRILLDKTGSGQLEVLSALTDEPVMRHKDIVEASSLSKGAVSNNLEKLRDKKLVEGETDISLNEDKILKLYREHLEAFLIRDSSEPEELNDLRTYFKTEKKVIENEGLQDLVLSVLKNARDREDLESLNSVFREVDRVIRETETNTELSIIGLITDKSNQVTENPEIVSEAENMLNEVKD